MKIAALILALALLALVGIRLYAWLNQAQEARVVVLVNPWNGIDNSGFTPRLRTVEGGFQVDKSCRRPLEQLLAECRAAGFQPKLRAAYRDREEQQRLFDEAVAQALAQGLSQDAAEELAQRRVGLPGYNEYELGLALDFGCEDGRQAELEQWLRENCWRFGFILRYPPGGEGVTGREADPAHFRYVGLAAAGQIFSMNVTLEEYMGMFFSESAQIIFEE